MTKQNTGVDIIYNIDDLDPGDIVEFMYPVSKSSRSQTFGVGILVEVITHRIGTKTIKLKNTSGIVLIPENKIRWEQTLHHKNKTGSKSTCQTKLST